MPSRSVVRYDPGFASRRVVSSRLDDDPGITWGLTGENLVRLVVGVVRHVSQRRPRHADVLGLTDKRPTRNAGGAIAAVGHVLERLRGPFEKDAQQFFARGRFVTDRVLPSPDGGNGNRLPTLGDLTGVRPDGELPVLGDGIRGWWGDSRRGSGGRQRRRGHGCGRRRRCGGR